MNEINVLEIPEVATLYARMLHVQQLVAETPEPEPGFLGLCHRKMRRTAARIRTGKYKVPGNVAGEQVAEALERTIRWEKTMKWARAELLDVDAQFAAIEGTAAARAMDEAVRVFHLGKKLVKERADDSELALSIETMKRAWRQSFPRARKRGRKSKVVSSRP